MKNFLAFVLTFAMLLSFGAIVFADDKFNENFYATIGVDFRFKNLIVDDKHVKLQIVSYIYQLYFYFNKNSGIQQVKKNLRQ